MLIFSLKASLEAPVSTISLGCERDAGTGRECSRAFCSAAQYAVCAHMSLCLCVGYGDVCVCVRSGVCLSQYFYK